MERKDDALLLGRAGGGGSGDDDVWRFFLKARIYILFLHNIINIKGRVKGMFVTIIML